MIARVKPLEKKAPTPEELRHKLNELIDVVNIFVQEFEDHGHDLFSSFNRTGSPRFVGHNGLRQ